MRTSLLSAFGASAIAAGVLFAAPERATAGDRWHHGHHGHHGHGFGLRLGGVGIDYGRPHLDWHDTTHWDYHPGYVVPHGNHYDYVPGHYHLHRDGHWDLHH